MPKDIKLLLLKYCFMDKTIIVCCRYHRCGNGKRIYLSMQETQQTWVHFLGGKYPLEVVVVVQSLSHVRLFATPRTATHQASLSFTISLRLLKLMSIESVMPSNHLILCHPLLLLSSIFPSIRAFSNKSALCVKWPKYWSFKFSISPSNEYSGLISFRIDWFDLLTQ